MIGVEEVVPYERPPLSKEYLRGEVPLEKTFIRSPEWYAENEVDLRLGARAVQVDTRSRELVLAGGDRVGFDRLLVATGGRNRKLDVLGVDLPGVFDLRRVGDADRIRAAV